MVMRYRLRTTPTAIPSRASVSCFRSTSMAGKPGFFRFQVNHLSGPAQPFDRYLILQPRHHDLAVIRSGTTVHRKQIPIQYPGIPHTLTPYTQQVIRTGRKKRWINRAIILDIFFSQQGTTGGNPAHQGGDRAQTRRRVPGVSPGMSWGSALWPLCVPAPVNAPGVALVEPNPMAPVISAMVGGILATLMLSCINSSTCNCLDVSVFILNISTLST